MKPINIISLSLWFLISLAIGFFYSSWATANGYRVPISGLSLSISIAVVSLILLGLALPIYRYKRQLKKVLEAKNNTVPRPVPVDPFYAVRVLVLAKASAITAALFIGWHLGVLAKLFISPVLATEAVGPNLTALIVSVVLIVVAFIVQSICRLPNDSGPKSDAVAA
ncbi:MAG: DUF3180 domain-containing protein [Rhodoluna sp.]